MSEWRETTLGEACRQGGGFVRTGPFGAQLHQSDYVDDPAAIPVVMPKDITDSRINLTSIARIDVATAARLSDHLLEPGDVVLSRRGDVGRSASIATTDVPVLCRTGSMRIHPGPSGDLQPGYLRYFMRSRTAIDYLEGQAVGATMPNLNAGIVSSMPIRIPPANAQSAIAHVLSSIEDLIENNRRRIDVLEQMAQAIYREWFVRFRYPGHEDATFVDSPLGPIPDGWEVVAVAKVAASKRNAVTSGPFGSKLGRKDYVNVGVPVLRGSNLSVGGGFSDDDLVFVSEEKADELRSSTATRGDVIITQRGTLGQVGLIPSDSEYETYVVSQSQMKVTVDDERMSAEFFYAQFRSPETTERFVSQAMSSGVPHVNLALLREFELVMPPHHLQAAFRDAVIPWSETEQKLRRSNKALEAVRDMLLPKLVSGQIDVSNLDLDALVETTAS